MTTARTIPVWRPLDGFSRDAFSDFDPTAGQADVVVIGAGVAGLVTALCLLRDGRQVTVIDREGIGEGETGRTTAHLASALDDRFHELARLHGKDGARLAAASHAAAIDWIEDFVSGVDAGAASGPERHARSMDAAPADIHAAAAMHGDTDSLRQQGADRTAGSGCGFRRIPGYLFPHDGDDSRLRREFDAARDAGLDVAWLEDGVPGLPAFRPALRFERQARINIDDYVLALAHAVQALGVRFVRGDVSGVEGGDRPTLTLHGGASLRAAAIVVATNVPFHETVTIHTKQAPYRSYVVAAEIEPGAAPDALIWDDGDPYHYVRLAEADDGSGRMFLIVGGEDHKVGQDDDPTAYVRLQEWTRRHFPAVGTFVRSWSGQVLEPADGLAFIGRDPGGKDNVYVVTGDSGNGITHGTLAGMLLSDLIAGRDNPWAGLFDPKRKMGRGGSEWLRENANVAAQYGDWLSRGDIATLDELAVGSGAVIRRGIHRVAVYRDAEQRVHAHSARCTHMGCSVRWSPQEKSFDCPCHGSRFDAVTGEVLNGPAVDPLPKFELAVPADTSQKTDRTP